MLLLAGYFYDNVIIKDTLTDELYIKSLCDNYDSIAYAFNKYYNVNNKARYAGFIKVNWDMIT
ncbi:MAG: hypothetical protein Q8942_09135 [Bacillota bacterium]|nr:hypothetical protein [Bacillota bacterium]